MNKHNITMEDVIQREQKAFERVMKEKGYIAKCPNCWYLNKTDKCEFCGTHFDIEKYAI